MRVEEAPFKTADFEFVYGKRTLGNKRDKLLYVRAKKTLPHGAHSIKKSEGVNYDDLMGWLRIPELTATDFLALRFALRNQQPGG